MFFTLILENTNGDRVDVTTTANQYMTSKIEGLNPPPGTISTSGYAGMDGSYLNNAFIEKRNVVIHFEMRGVEIEKKQHQLYVGGETLPIPEEKYIELLKTRGSEKLVLPQTASESKIVAHNTQYQYNKDYFVGDNVTVEHKRFGMIHPKMQLIGMIEGFDRNGRSLTPTFRKG